MRIFESGRIGALETRNRIVMPAMTTRTASEDGAVTDATLAYYLARARGGVGLITVEMAAVEPAGRHRRHEVGLHDDRFLPGLSRLAAALKAEGAAVSIQLGHAGGHTHPSIAGETPVAPSDVPHLIQEGALTTVVRPEAMDLPRIARTVAAYAAAAARAAAAGFDCVEVQVAHGYLLSQFLCPAENLRTDAYGGSLENRARISLEVVRAIRRTVPGLPVIVRLGAEDFFDGGVRLGDAMKVAPWLEAAGADAIHVTAGHYRSRPIPTIVTPPMAYPEATFADLAAAIRAVVAVPVIAVGRLGDPAVAEAVLAEGKADFIALGRPLVADPDWPRTVAAGRAERRCLACNTCVSVMRGGHRLHCLVNPATGRELEIAAGRLPAGERIIVVGGGPAGLTYAALAGAANRVLLVEASGRLGGALLMAGQAELFQSVPANPQKLAAFVASLAERCREAGVEIRTGTRLADLPAPILAAADRIVLATGARYRGGLTGLVRWLLDAGAAHRWPLRPLFRRPRLRDLFYYRLRRPALPPLPPGLGARIEVIGDARRPGKSGAAIASAAETAYAVTFDPRATRAL